ncbi:MAG: hypothetical protein WBD64_09660 [Candidatus Zixiibacteriota bacterium]
MKSLIKVLGGMVLCALFIFLGAQLLFVPSKVGFTQEANQIRPIRPSKSQDTIPQETYVSEVMLRAPWAEKNLVDDGEESPPGEFGIRVYSVPESLKEFGDVPPPEGPTSFTVAPNGDIYITDPFNKRIQKFDENGNFVSVIPIPPLEKSEHLHIQELPELSDSAKEEMLRRAGKLPKTHDQNHKEPNDVQVGPKTINGYQYVWSLICVDRSNNVYLLWWGDYTKQTLCKYNQEGQLLATYPFFPEVRISGVGNKLYCDHSDRLFLESYRKDTDKIVLSLKEELLLKKRYALFTFQIGTADRVFNPEEQKRTLRKGAVKTGNARESTLHWSPEEGVIVTKWYKQP